MAAKFYWVKERHNPQFKKTIFKDMGQITKKEAMAHENTLYGRNYMHSFKTHQEALDFIQQHEQGDSNV